MFPPLRPLIWQCLAHAAHGAAFCFASHQQFDQDKIQTLARHADGRLRDDCYPSSYPWPGSLWAGPFFWRRIADLVRSLSLGFPLAQNTVKSPSIKTITRGRAICGTRPLSSWQFVQPPLRAVCKPLNSAALPVLSVAHFWQTRSTRIWLQARRSADLRAWHLAAHPAFQPATDLIASFNVAIKAIRATRLRVAFSHPQSTKRQFA